MLPNGAQVPFTNSQIEKSVSISSDPYQVCDLAISSWKGETPPET